MVQKRQLLIDTDYGPLGRLEEHLTPETRERMPTVLSNISTTVTVATELEASKPVRNRKPRAPKHARIPRQ